ARDAQHVASRLFFLCSSRANRDLHSFPTRRSSDLGGVRRPLEAGAVLPPALAAAAPPAGPRSLPGRRLLPAFAPPGARRQAARRSEEHTSELQSRENLVCRLLLEKKNKDHRECLYV